VTQIVPLWQVIASCVTLAPASFVTGLMGYRLWRNYRHGTPL